MRNLHESVNFSNDSSNEICSFDSTDDYIKKQTDNRPFLEVYVANRHILCLVDSGASKSICNASGSIFFSSLGYKLLKTRMFSASLADGTLCHLQEYFSIPITFETKTVLINFFVCKSSPQKFLLGSDFYTEFELDMSYRNKVWKFKSNAYESNNSIVSSIELTPEQSETLSCLITKFNSLCTEKLGRSNVFEHNIDTGDAEPIYKRPYPVSPANQQKMSRELDRMIKLGVVEPADSPWCQQPVLVKKKSGKDRLCIDCRSLNKITKKSKYALPRIDCILSRLGKAKFISSIDLNDAFWQIPLNIHSRPKTAFNIPGRGMYQFKVVPFGLTTSAQAMQRLMDGLFHDDGIFIYIDDIIIVSETFDEHIRQLNTVFRKLKSANLTNNIEKCAFCRPALKYLGYVVDKFGLRTDPEKVECIANYDKPKTIRELRRFMGMTSYYRKFIKNFAELAAPLHDLTKTRKRILK